ncbi:MAG: type II toxin-antitoxin system antitoxin SocA domain-containing protein [Pseudomonadota bacterium]
MRTAQSVADDLLKLAKRRGKMLTPMQLMKLVYISYGWFLAMHGQRLFHDRIEAWKYGPVIPSLYHVTKHFGSRAVPHTMIADGPLSHPEIENFLTGVVDGYGDYSGIALSNLTHRDGTPWQQVFRPNHLNIEIPDGLIQEHYQRSLDARQSAAGAAS